MKTIIMIMMTLVTAANAALMIGIDGVPAGDEVVVSGGFDLQVIVTEQFAGGTFALVADAPVLDTDWISFISRPLTRVWEHEWVDARIAFTEAYHITDSSDSHIEATGGNRSWNTIGDYILLDDLVFQCGNSADVTIQLIAVSDLIYYTYPLSPWLPVTNIMYPAGALIDTVWMRQIPEPATVILLGLSLLFLMIKFHHPPSS